LYLAEILPTSPFDDVTSAQFEPASKPKDVAGSNRTPEGSNDDFLGAVLEDLGGRPCLWAGVVRRTIDATQNTPPVQQLLRVYKSFCRTSRHASPHIGRVRILSHVFQADDL